MATKAGTPEVAKAIVTIIPSMEGSRSKISDMIVPASDQAGKEAGSSIGGKIGEGLSTAKLAIGNAIGNIVASAVSSAASGIKSTLSDAFQGFGDYQQLSGGVETLFKGSADIVAENARKAFRTAGVSANQYMETVTGFSASLIQSLGGDTEKAARIADIALTDMSDNANKMGTDLSSIEWAYQGFAKQNYTMLDNLKLGYGGTKKEMERLLKDATELTKAQGNYREFSLDSYSDIIEAIHLVQDNIGITGTTSLEAATTIQGSMGMAKASWQDFLTGLANPDADMKELSRNLVDSLGTALSNILPTVKNIGSGIGEGLADMLGEAGFTGASDFVRNASGVLESAKEAFGTIFDRVINNTQVQKAAARIEASFKKIAHRVEDFVSRIAGVPVSIDDIVDGIADFVSGGLNLFADALEWIADHCEGIFELLWDIGQAVAEFTSGIADFFSKSEAGKKIIDELAGIIEDTLGGALEIVLIVAQLLMDEWDRAVDFFENDPLGQEVADTLYSIADVVGSVFSVIHSTIKVTMGLIKGVLTGDWSDLYSELKEHLGNSKNLTENIMSAVRNIVQTSQDITRRNLEIGWELMRRGVVVAWNNTAQFLEDMSRKIPEFFANLPQTIARQFAMAADWSLRAFDFVLNNFARIPDQIVGFFETLPKRISQIFTRIVLPQFHVVGNFNLDPANLKLPRLELYAHGGIVTKPTNALIGEGGYPEAVLPLTSRYLTPLLAAADVRGGGGDTYNVINGLEVAPDDYIQDVMVEFFEFLQRKAAMQRG